MPYLSLRLAYCCFKVLRNHFSTSNERLAGSGSEAGATRREGCSFQYAENSVREVVPKMKGGAVMEERSPLKEAMDYHGYQCFEDMCDRSLGWRTLRNEDQEPLFWGATPPPSSFDDNDMIARVGRILGKTQGS